MLSCLGTVSLILRSFFGRSSFQWWPSSLSSASTSPSVSTSYEINNSVAPTTSRTAAKTTRPSTCCCRVPPSTSSHNSPPSSTTSSQCGAARPVLRHHCERHLRGCLHASYRRHCQRKLLGEFPTLLRCQHVVSSGFKWFDASAAADWSVFGPAKDVCGLQGVTVGWRVWGRPQRA